MNIHKNISRIESEAETKTQTKFLVHRIELQEEEKVLKKFSRLNVDINPPGKKIQKRNINSFLMRFPLLNIHSPHLVDALLASVPVDLKKISLIFGSINKRNSHAYRQGWRRKMDRKPFFISHPSLLHQ